MQDVQNDRRMSARSVVNHSRRASMLFAVKLLGGVALFISAATGLTHSAAAEQSDIVLTASASEVGARPGSAYAQGNAALAAADQDSGAIAGSVASTPPEIGTTPPESITSDDTEVGISGRGQTGSCHRCRQ